MVIGLAIGGVALVTALSYWHHLLGARGIAVVVATLVVVVVGVVVLPERAWNRLMAVDTLSADLGELHAEGAMLRSIVPWVPDEPRRLPWTLVDPGDPQSLDNWISHFESWDKRVQGRLEGTPWIGTFLSPLARVRVRDPAYDRAATARFNIDDRLERLAQIIAAIEKRR